MNKIIEALQSACNALSLLEGCAIRGLCGECELPYSINEARRLNEPCVHIEHFKGEITGYKTASCNGAKIYYPIGKFCPHCGRKVKYED